MRHGTRSAYTQGCRCEACTKANNDYWHKREKAKAREQFGAPTTYMDAGPVRDHIKALVKSGWSLREICREFSIPRSTVRNITTKHPRTGKPVEKCLRKTGEAILRIQPIPKPICSICGREIRNNADTMRSYGVHFVCYAMSDPRATEEEKIRAVKAMRKRRDRVAASLHDVSQEE